MMYDEGLAFCLILDKRRFGVFLNSWKERFDETLKCVPFFFWIHEGGFLLNKINL